MSDLPAWPIKDPDEVLDYSVNWTARLPDDDKILTSTWTIPTGLTLNAQTIDGFITTVWMSVGVSGVTYKIYNTITTQAGRTLQEAVQLVVRSL
jgi:hypothetical protein